MQFVQEHTINCDNLKSFNDILSEIDTLFEPSQVYEVATETKIIMPEQRLSEFRTLTDNRLFDLCDQVIKMINNKNNENNNTKKFHLYRNDIMHIRYNKGGYFKDHEDYLSLTSNFLEEYSLLICVDADCVGGETILHINDFFQHPSKATITTGGCLLFRKDIIHKGSELLSGHKIILTFNVWCIENITEQILVVKFNNDNRTHILPTNKIKEYPHETMLKRYIDTPIGKKVNDKNDTIIEYHEKYYTYDEFDLVRKIYAGNAIDIDEINEREELLDYYLFDKKMILAKRLKDKTDNLLMKMKDDIVITSDFYLFSDRGHQIEFLSHVKEEKMPYMPFRIMFCEGRLTFGGEMEGTDPVNYKMAPIYATFSDKNNVLTISSLMHTFINHDYYPKYKKNIIQHPESKEFFDECKKDSLVHFNCGYIEDFVDGERELGTDSIYMQIAFTGQSFNPCLICYDDSNSLNNIVEIITRKYTNDYTFKKSGKYKGEKCEFYTIDENNNIVINPCDYNNIIKKINKIKLYNQIPPLLNQLNIPNTQKTYVGKDHFYCNENVYGNFNIIMVYGALFMGTK